MRVHTKSGLVGWSLLLGVAAAAASASADLPKVGAATPTVTFKRTALKASTQPAGTLSAADHAKVRAALDSALTAYGQHKDPKKLLAAGASFAGDAAAAFQVGASKATARRANGTPSAGGGGGVTVAGGTSGAVALPPTYSLDAGDVVNATFAAPCDGNIELSFTVKNRGTKLPDGATPRLVVSLARGDGAALSSAWVNLPVLNAGATTTVQVPALRHRAPGSDGACPNGTIVVTPTFVDVAAASDYRLRIELRPDGADATLLSGLFMAPQTPGSSNECGGMAKKCSSGVCAAMCPPCPGGFTESNGGCYPSWWGQLGGLR